MLFAIDIDATLVPFWPSFRKELLRRTGVNLPYKNQTEFLIGKNIPKITDEVINECIEFVHSPENMKRLKPYKGSIGVVNRWFEDGHFICIISNRNPELQMVTEEWIAELGFRFDRLLCCDDKSLKLNELECDLLIDDKLETIRKEIFDGAGHVATLIHPWNAELFTKKPHIFSMLGRRGAKWVIGAHTWAVLEQRINKTLVRGKPKIEGISHG